MPAWVGRGWVLAASGAGRTRAEGSSLAEGFGASQRLYGRKLRSQKLLPDALFARDLLAAVLAEQVQADDEKRLWAHRERKQVCDARRRRVEADRELGIGVGTYVLHRAVQHRCAF